MLSSRGLPSQWGLQNSRVIVWSVWKIRIAPLSLCDSSLPTWLGMDRWELGAMRGLASFLALLSRTQCWAALGAQPTG